MRTRPDIKKLKEKNQYYAHWGSTVGAAFQRSKPYKKGYHKELRDEFQKALFTKIKELEIEYFEGEVSEVKHVANLNKLHAWSKEYSKLFESGTLKYGICQKILNVHLKGLWCQGLIHTPPHCPIDRLIQQHLKIRPVVAWSTQIRNAEDYMLVIERIRLKANSEGFESLAEFELVKYLEIIEDRRS